MGPVVALFMAASAAGIAAYAERDNHHPWTQHDIAKMHPDNIYVPHCKGGFAECGRDSARHHQDSNGQQY